MELLDYFLNINFKVPQLNYLYFNYIESRAIGQ